MDSANKDYSSGTGTAAAATAKGCAAAKVKDAGSNGSAEDCACCLFAGTTDYHCTFSATLGRVAVGCRHFVGMVQLGSSKGFGCIAVATKKPSSAATATAAVVFAHVTTIGLRSYSGHH